MMYSWYDPDWCANCKGLKTPEEEKEILDREVENLHLRWDR